MVAKSGRSGTGAMLPHWQYGTTGDNTRVMKRLVSIMYAYHPRFVVMCVITIRQKLKIKTEVTDLICMHILQQKPHKYAVRVHDNSRTFTNL